MFAGCVPAGRITVGAQGGPCADGEPPPGRARRAARARGEGPALAGRHSLPRRPETFPSARLPGGGGRGARGEAPTRRAARPHRSGPSRCASCLVAEVAVVVVAAREAYKMRNGVGVGGEACRRGRRRWPTAIPLSLSLFLCRQIVVHERLCSSGRRQHGGGVGSSMFLWFGSRHSAARLRRRSGANAPAAPPPARSCVRARHGDRAGDALGARGSHTHRAARRPSTRVKRIPARHSRRKRRGLAHTASRPRPRAPSAPSTPKTPWRALPRSPPRSHAPRSHLQPSAAS